MAATTHSTSFPAVRTTATPLTPSPTRVAATVRGPLDFGVSATGGSSADCFAAIMGQLAAMKGAGQIGEGACDRPVTPVCRENGTVAA